MRNLHPRRRASMSFHMEVLPGGDPAELLSKSWRKYTWHKNIRLSLWLYVTKCGWCVVVYGDLNYVDKLGSGVQWIALVCIQCLSLVIKSNTIGMTVREKAVNTIDMVILFAVASIM